MYTSTARLTFYAPHVHSLKEKRQLVKSLVDKTRHKFNVAIAEVADQDVHQTLSIGIAVVSSTHSHAEKMLHEIIRYMEEHAGVDMVGVETESL